MRPRTLAALLALGPLPAAAQTGLRADDHLVLEYHLDNGNRDKTDDDYGTVIERLTLSGSAENLSTFAELQAEAFQGPDDDRHENAARLARFGVDYALGDVTLTVGDFHRQLGRGLILSLRKIDELGVDTTLQGGRIAFTPKDHDLDVFAGRTNAERFDVPSEFSVAPAGDTIVGGAYTTRVLPGATLGTYAYTLRTPEPRVRSAGFDHQSASGGFVELPELWDVLAFYLEADWQGRKAGEDRTNGKAFYSTLDLNVGGFSALIEGLLVDNVNVQFRRSTVPFDYAGAPTLERMDQEVESGFDVRGLHTRLSYGFLDGDLAPYVSGMLRENDPESDTPLYQLHTYGGVDWTYDGGRSRLGVSGGYRRHTLDGQITKEMRHVETDYVQALPAGHALHVTANEEFRRLETRDYVRGTAIVGVERQRLGGISVEVGNDTQNPTQRELYVAGIVTWKAADWAELRFTGGSERGGLKCVGGVCREFPAFTGAKLDATLHHDLM